MIINVSLRPGTTLSNVRYRWITNGILGSEISTGITQPDATYPLFRFNVTPVYGSEELIIYDSTDSTNWNVGTPTFAI